MILVFLMLIFNPALSLSSCTFVKRLLSSSSLSAIRVVSSADLRLLIFLPAVLISACASFSLAFHLMYSAYKLNKQGDNIQPWHSTFPIWNQSIVPRPILTIASWPAYSFLRRHVRWSGTPISIPGHSWASLTQSLVGTLLPSPVSWCTWGLVCVLQESVSPVLCKFCNQVPLFSKVKFPKGSHLLGGSMVGLMATSSKRAYATCSVT